MRWIERVFGVLAGILGIAALIVTVTQHAIIEHSGSAMLVISSAKVKADRLAIAILVALAALGAVCVTLSRSARCGTLAAGRRAVCERRWW
jgi:hypothetical protein